ncbi:MAG TPA: phage baseplate assembly protein [Bradyrhizobium sp.]|nr:phage baseplate assembly protein [Bradyrhizobium sp.]
MNGLDRLATRFKHAMRFGRLLLTDDTGPVQRLQADFGPIDASGKSLGIRDRLPRLVEYGLASSPPAGSDVVVTCHDGDLSNAVVVATNHQASRLKNLNPGDVALYDNRGNTIVLSAAGITLTPCAGGKVFIDGELDATGDVKAGGISLMNHVHPGVQTGSGDTEAPTG